MTFYAVMFPEKHKLDIAENVCVTAFIVISLAFASVVFYVNQYASSSKAILELSALIAVSIGPIIIMVYLMYNIKRLIAILKAREGWSCLWASPLYGPDETDDNNG